MEHRSPFPRALPGLLRLPSRWTGLLALIFLGIFALRAWMIERFAASVAMVDEWQATAGEILAPWSQGTLTWAALFQAHNGDHRILATRLLEIACYTVNGAWDPQLVLTVKAGVYALAATLFIHLLAGGLTARRKFAALLLGVLLAFPFNYQNLIWAFQSQFDFFLLAVAAGWIALLRRRLVPALAIAFAALFTIGAGPVLAASYVPFLAWRAWREPLARWAALAGLAAALAVAAWGASLRSAAAPLGTAGTQAETFASALGWPYSNLLEHVTSPRSVKLIPPAVRNFPSPETSWVLRAAGMIDRHPRLQLSADLLAGLLQLLPTLVLAGGVWRRRVPARTAAGPLALAGFALLMTAATAVARGGQSSISVRYLDLIALNGFAALGAAFALLQTHARWRRWIVAWGLCLLPGYLAIMGGTLAKLSHRMPAYWLANLQAYFVAHDHSLLADNRDARWPILEDASVAEFMDFLDDPQIAAVLPPSLTRPSAPLPWASAAARWVRRLSAPLTVMFAGVLLWQIAGRIRRILASRHRLHPPPRIAPGLEPSH